MKAKQQTPKPQGTQNSNFKDKTLKKTDENTEIDLQVENSNTMETNQVLRNTTEEDNSNAEALGDWPSDPLTKSPHQRWPRPTEEIPL